MVYETMNGTGDPTPTIQLRRFDPAKMKDNVTVLVTAKRGSGKSVLIKDLLYHKRNLPAGIVMSATEGGNHFFSKFVPEIFIHSEFDEEILRGVLTRQKIRKLEGKPNSEIFIVMDDMAFNKQNLRSPVLRELFLNGRHWLCNVFMGIQYSMDMSVDIRSNIDFAFLLKENSLANRERLYRSFGGVVPTFEMFNRIFDAATDGYGCLVIDGTSRSTKIEDVMYYYEADPDLDFNMGSPALWRLNQEVYDPQYILRNIYEQGDRSKAVPSKPARASTRAKPRASKGKEPRDRNRS